MAALRFRFAPPTGDHGAEGDHALTIKPDHSVGADHLSPWLTTNFASSQNLRKATIIVVFALPASSDNRRIDAGLPGDAFHILDAKFRRYVRLPNLWRNQSVSSKRIGFIFEIIGAFQLQIVENTLRSPLACSPNQLRDDRQIRAFGPEGQRIIRELHFGIIGAGGTGSIIEQQLALLGAARVTIIDPDEIEATNLNRVVGTNPGDVGRPKVEVAARMMSQINPDIDVIPIQADIVDDDTASQLAGFDFIFLCTDSHASRAVVNQASYQYLVPAVDMGVSITVKDGVITHITGRVKMLAPGLSCLTCTQTLDSEQIRREMLTPGQRAADPYVQGVHEPQPAVISLNSTVASLAMTMMLSAVTSIPSKPRALRYDGISGQTRAMNTTPVEACIVCSAEGALGQGKAWPLPVRPNQTERNAA